MSADNLAILLMISLVMNIALIFISVALYGENQSYHDRESRIEKEIKRREKNQI